MHALIYHNLIQAIAKLHIYTLCCPSLTWRDVQYLIVHTSNPNDLINGDWRVNGAGLRVSHKHGFGAIDAEAMVTRAKRWINVPPQSTSIIGTSNKTG